MKFEPELLKGNTKHLILAILLKEDMHGYEMIREIRDRTNELLEYGEGSIYPALHLLEKDKYVKSYWMQAENGRDRKYYSITAKGKKKLRIAVKEWKLYSDAVDSLLKGLRLMQS